MGQPEIRHIWKILEILKSEPVNVFGLCAALEEKEINTFKSSVFTLLQSSCSSSRFDRAGFKCLRVFLTGHFCCFGTSTHGIPVPRGTASNAALHWHHSWGAWNVYQLSRSKVCRHWVEQQYATKLTVVLLEEKKTTKGEGGEQLSVKIKAPGSVPHRQRAGL